jgi:hypothetical protein
MGYPLKFIMRDPAKNIMEGIPTVAADGESLEVTGSSAQWLVDAPYGSLVTCSLAGAVTLDIMIPEEITEFSSSVVEGLMETLSTYDRIVMTRGTGSKVYNDYLISNGKALSGITLRAFRYTDVDSIDWTTLKARDVTAPDGKFTFFLDPGTYEVSIERKGIQLGTTTITVTE